MFKTLTETKIEELQILLLSNISFAIIKKYNRAQSKALE